MELTTIRLIMLRLRATLASKEVFLTKPIVPWIWGNKNLIAIFNGTLNTKIYSSLMDGKKITSLIESCSVNNITILSTPIPTPPVGGIPASKTSINSLSKT